MKTAISLPEAIFKEAEQFARRTKKTRSQLYSEAIAEYLARHAPNDITETMNDVCDRLGQFEPQFIKAAAQKTLKKEQW
jgi:predicted DNA-binding protein